MRGRNDRNRCTGHIIPVEFILPYVTLIPKRPTEEESCGTTHDILGADETAIPATILLNAATTAAIDGTIFGCCGEY